MPGELITPEGVIASAGAKLLYDVLGPSAKIVGKKLGSYSEVGVNNLERVLKNALERLKTRGKNGGAVPPRVIQHVLADAFFCDNEVQAQYLGGILASAKSPVSRDDRAISHLALLATLSSYQIRTHYITYSSILRWDGKGADQVKDWISFRYGGLTVAIAERDYRTAMEFSEEEPADAICDHAFVGLEKKGLLEGGLVVIPARGTGGPGKRGSSFRYFYPTLLGVELFLWGLGHGDKATDEFTPDLIKDENLFPTVKPLRLELGRVSW